MVFFKEILNTTFKKIAIITIVFSILSGMFFFFYLIPNINKVLIEERKQLIHEISEEFIEMLYELNEKEKEGLIAEGMAREIAIDTINNFRYGENDDEYFWANRLDNGVMIAHPYEDLHGSNLGTYTDPDGYNFGRVMLERAQDDDHSNNFVSYKWTSKSDPEKYVPKLSHVTKFEPWGWMIGTGIYMNDVQIELTAITQRLVGLFMFILALMIGLLFYIVKAGSMIEKQKNIIQLEFKSLIQNIPVGIFKTKLDPKTKKDTPVIWNDSLIRLCEIPNDKFIIKNKLGMQSLLREKDREIVIDKMLSGKEILGEDFKIKTIKGNDLWIKLFARPVKKEDGLYVDASVEDITKKRRLRKKIGVAYNELKKIEKTKSDIISITSHELRTPLTIIKGFASILTYEDFGDITEKQRENLVEVIKSTDELLEMITNMLDLEKLETGKMQLIKKDVHIKEVLTEIREESQIRCALENKRITLSLPSTAIIVETDPVQIKRIFSNLVDNAIKFTKSGKGQIEIFTKNINSDKIEIHVKDNGIGISELDTKNVFEKFKQVGDHIERTHSGTGLGLPLVKKLVTELGGSIKIKSTVGKGSDFYVTLSLKK